MLELGKIQKMILRRITVHGAYLGMNDCKDEVLLPGGQIPKDAKVGDTLEVFIYRDSKDRMISTVHRPAMQLHEVARLKVVSTSSIGAFLDWGLEKDLFLPFKEQTHKIKDGDYCVVALYVDKSERLCATMRIYDYLSMESPYKEGDSIKGVIYQINPKIGALVAVDLKYHGLIPNKEFFAHYREGDEIEGRVLKVREDGKLNLSIREKSYLQIDGDAQMILERIIERGGSLPFTDKAAPLIIKQEFGLSKNAFKRAVGRLLKENKVEIGEKSIQLKK
ncbi:S1 RNA binding domain protein [Lachnospiraceae bacterium TWA4]|nr:S1 RNA binding domain protein [Lachnospiraceae bacterium TWA4]